MPPAVCKGLKPHAWDFIGADWLPSQAYAPCAVLQSSHTGLDQAPGVQAAKDAQQNRLHLLDIVGRRQEAEGKPAASLQTAVLIVLASRQGSMQEANGVFPLFRGQASPAKTGSSADRAESKRASNAYTPDVSLCLVVQDSNFEVRLNDLLHLLEYSI